MTAVLSATRASVGIIDLVFDGVGEVPHGSLAAHAMTIAHVAALADAARKGASGCYRIEQEDRYRKASWLQPEPFDGLILAASTDPLPEGQSGIGDAEQFVGRAEVPAEISTAANTIYRTFEGRWGGMKSRELELRLHEESAPGPMVFGDLPPAFELARVSMASPLEVTLAIVAGTNTVLAMVNFLWMVRMLRRGMRQFELDDLDGDIERLTKLIQIKELEDRYEQLHRRDGASGGFPVKISSARARMED